MSLTAAASGFVVFLLSVQVIRGQQSWGVFYSSTQICALKGSTVEIRCSYFYPYRWKNSDTNVQKTFWYTKMKDGEPVDLETDSEYSGRVQNSCREKSCTLTITNLRESDLTIYRFRFVTNQQGGQYTGEPGATLFVTDPVFTVKVRTSYTWLECHSSCRLPDRPSYIWYKNGLKIDRATSSSYSGMTYADSFSCALSGYEDFPSLPVCYNSPFCNRVIYSERSICALEGSSVDISCTYDTYNYAYIESKFWYNPERSHSWLSHLEPQDLREDSQYFRRVEVLEGKNRRSTLRIRGLRENDSAQYRFKFRTSSFEWRSSLPSTTLTVTAVRVQVTRLGTSWSRTSAELKCHISCSPADRPSYVWFKNKDKVTGVQTSSYTAFLSLGDEVFCALNGYEEFHSPSVYAPKLPSVSVNPSAEIMEGRSVTLNCSSDANPAANYTWYKENGTLKTVLNESQQLVFSSIQSSDSGQYHCTAENELGTRTSRYVSIDVKYAPKRPSVSVSPSAEIMEGRSVTLNCSSDANPAANYTWYKENQPLLPEQEGIYHFSSISSEDRGIYYCRAENQYDQINSTSVHIDVQYAPKLPSVSVSPSGEIMEGSSVTLTCSSDANPAASYTWYKENEDSPAASGPIFTITDTRAEHSGNYYCEAKNKRGRHISSTLYLSVVADPMKSIAAGSIVAVLLVVILSVFAFLLIRRKKSSKRSTEPLQRESNNAQLNTDSVYDTPSVAVTPAQQQDELHYASVIFKNKQDPLYSNIRLAPPNRHKDEEDVEYTDICIKSTTATTESSPKAVEDSCALYSTVNMHKRTQHQAEVY